MINVLLVDDHELVRAGIRRILEDIKGIKVAGEACCGEDAVKWCRTNSADVVLMDMKMPVMDGLEATRQIREAGSSVPIIAVTAYAYDSDRAKALDVGCDDYIAKPLTGDVLKKKLRKHLKR